MTRGFVSPLLVVGIIAGVLAVGVVVQTKRVESCKAEAAAFVAQVEANGKAAEAAAKRKEAQDAKQIQGALSERDAALKRLRNNNTAARRLSDNAAGSAAGSTVCIPTPAYNAAMGEFGKSLGRFLGETRRYSEEGDAAQIDAVALIKAWPLKMDTLK